MNGERVADRAGGKTAARGAAQERHRARYPISREVMRSPRARRTFGQWTLQLHAVRPLRIHAGMLIERNSER